jgi:hypothetical protein
MDYADSNVVYSQKKKIPMWYILKAKAKHKPAEWSHKLVFFFL